MLQQKEFDDFQMLKKMEQAKKKAEAVVNTVDISEREKMAQLKRCDQKSGVCNSLLWQKGDFHQNNVVLFPVFTRKQAWGRRREK